MHFFFVNLWILFFIIMAKSAVTLKSSDSDYLQNIKLLQIHINIYNDQKLKFTFEKEEESYIKKVLRRNFIQKIS